MKVQPFYIAVCDDDEKDRKEIAEMAEQNKGQGEKPKTQENA